MSSFLYKKIWHGISIHTRKCIPKKMLIPGEYNDLILAVNEANGFNSGMAEKIKRAKN